MRNSGAMADKSMDMCIKNIAHGDMVALKELYDELRVPVYQFALSIVKSPASAEDIAQETFLRIRAYAPAYRPQGKPRAWIFSIARNLAVSELRKAAKVISIEDRNDIPFSHMDKEGFAVSSLLDVLNDEEKEIVTLHVLADLKHSDIAKTLNMPYEQVRWKYAYAMKKLKKHLTQSEIREGVSIETEQSGY